MLLIPLSGLYPPDPPPIWFPSWPWQSIWSPPFIVPYQHCGWEGTLVFIHLFSQGNWLLHIYTWYMCLVNLKYFLIAQQQHWFLWCWFLVAQTDAGQIHISGSKQHEWAYNLHSRPRQPALLLSTSPHYIFKMQAFVQLCRPWQPTHLDSVFMGNDSVYMCGCLTCMPTLYLYSVKSILDPICCLSAHTPSYWGVLLPFWQIFYYILPTSDNDWPVDLLVG